MRGKYRRRYLVDKRLQFRFVLFCVAYLFISHLGLSLSLFVPLASQLQNPDTHTREVLSAVDKVLYLHVHYWPLAILSLVIVCLPVIYLSRRIVGPLLRLKMTLDKMRSGQIPKPYQSRRGDYLIEETDTVNAVLDNFRLKVSEIKEAHAYLHEGILALSDKVGSESIEELSKMSEALADSSSELKKRMDYFQIES